MGTRARQWAGFKKRKEYPLLEFIELPKEGEEILVWGIDREGDGYVESDIFVYKDGSGRLWLYDDRGTGQDFAVDDDDFHFIAWLPTPTIENVLADSGDFWVKKWWLKDIVKATDLTISDDEDDYGCYSGCKDCKEILPRSE